MLAMVPTTLALPPIILGHSSYYTVHASYNIGDASTTLTMPQLYSSCIKLYWPCFSITGHTSLMLAMPPITLAMTQAMHPTTLVVPNVSHYMAMLSTTLAHSDTYHTGYAFITWPRLTMMLKLVTAYNGITFIYPLSLHAIHRVLNACIHKNIETL